MIRLQRRPGTMLPTLEQHHLLRAALLTDPAEAGRAFSEWASRVPLERADAGSVRLLPMVYRNLQRHGIGHEWMPRLKGIYRQTWLRNELLIDHGARALTLLRDAGIESILLKGAALIATVYDESALRPMEDFDFLVRGGDFSRAIDVLLSGEWRLHPEVVDRESYCVFRHAVCLQRDRGGELDVHWSSLSDFADASRADELWNAALPARIRGVDTRVLAPSDQLLHICAHAAAAHRTVAPIRWAADVAHLLDRHRAAIDWEWLVHEARRSGRSALLAGAFEYLHDGLDVAIPDRVIQDLRRSSTALQSLRLRIRIHGGRIGYAGDAIVLLRRVFTSPFSSVLRRAALLVRFVRSFARPASLPVFVLSRLIYGRGGSGAAR